MAWRKFLTCSLVAGGLLLASSAWAAAPAARPKAAPPATPAHQAPAPATDFARFLAGFIPCPFCSPRIPCPRC